MNMGNVWLYCAAALMLALIPCGITCFRGKPADRLVGLEMAGVVVTLDMVLLAEGFQRTLLYDIPLTLAILSFGGGMVFARFLERWL
jgi:multicomponent Na+:H+ antiporter subunit F